MKLSLALLCSRALAVGGMPWACWSGQRKALRVLLFLVQLVQLVLLLSALPSPVSCEHQITSGYKPRVVWVRGKVGLDCAEASRYPARL